MSLPSRVEDLYLAALKRNTPADRAAFLDEACRGDPELRLRLERLLHPSLTEEASLPGPTVDEAATVDSGPSDLPDEIDLADVAVGESAGDRLGPYKLVRRIGEGGMGTVWVAEQQEPVRRTVALKVVKAGTETARRIARFEAERQALALMEHPNIARVLDAGATARGQPYVVMELVEGAPITDYCEKRQLTTRERLELFVPVCLAIAMGGAAAAAHSLLGRHRDTADAPTALAAGA